METVSLMQTSNGTVAPNLLVAVCGFCDAWDYPIELGHVDRPGHFV